MDARPHRVLLRCLHQTFEIAIARLRCAIALLGLVVTGARKEGCTMQNQAGLQKLSFGLGIAGRARLSAPGP